MQLHYQVINTGLRSTPEGIHGGKILSVNVLVSSNTKFWENLILIVHTFSELISTKADSICRIYICKNIPEFIYVRVITRFYILFRVHIKQYWYFQRAIIKLYILFILVIYQYCYLRRVITQLYIFFTFHILNLFTYLYTCFIYIVFRVLIYQYCYLLRVISHFI